MMSSRMGKRAQQAAFVAVFLPSGHATRRVSAATTTTGQDRYIEQEYDSDNRTASTLNGGDNGDEGEQCFEGHDRRA